MRSYTKHPHLTRSSNVQRSINITGEYNKTIIHLNVAARVLYSFNEQAAQATARAER